MHNEFSFSVGLHTKFYTHKQGYCITRSFALFKKFFSKPMNERFFYIHAQDGNFYNDCYFKKWIWLVKRNPQTTFIALIRNMNEYINLKRPSNLHIISLNFIHINANIFLLNKKTEFSFDCPKNRNKKERCKMCMHCYLKDGFVYMREDIMNSYRLK